MEETISHQVAVWIEAHDGTPFFASDLFDVVGAKTRSQKQNVNKIIERLLTKGEIKKATFKNGDIWRGRFTKV